MMPENEISMLDLIPEFLGRIWSPCAEAVRLQAESNAGSLEETAAAAERAGCRVCYVDLPEKVSGFAEMIEGQPHIVLNRIKSRNNLEYTLPHELGHHVLHLNSFGDARRLDLSVPGTAEVEANLFAVSWIAWPGIDQRRDEVLRDNKEATATLLGCLFVTMLLVLLGLMCFIGSKLFPEQQRTALPEPL